MNNDINKKTSPNQMRILMKRMRVGSSGKFEISETDSKPKKDLNMRDMLKITRNLNEEFGGGGEQPTQNKETVFDPKIEQETFLKAMKPLNVNVEFFKEDIHDNYVFWGGIVDGIIEFVYSVTPYEATTKVTFDYKPDFSPDNPQNDEIVKKIESHFETTFKPYWLENIIQK